MTAISQALTAALLHFIWQGTAVALLLWIALFLLRRSSPDVRYAASGAALATMALLPAVTAWFVHRPGAPIARVIVSSFALPAGRATGAPPLEWLSLAREWILPLWAAGVAIFALRLALAWRHVALLRRAAESADTAIAQAAAAIANRMHVARPIRVLVSNLADAPSAIGWLRPAVLLPAAVLAGLDAAQLEAILAHELAHLRRHDYLVNTAQTIIETLLFYHPAVWWVSSRMRQERELCCDDLAVRECGDAVRYARALARLERMRAAPQPAVAANGGSLLYRIQRLTGAARECAPSRLPMVVAAIAIILCIPFGAYRVQARPQAARPATAVQSPPAPAPIAAAPRQAAPKQTTETVVVDATLDGNGYPRAVRVVSGPEGQRNRALRFLLERKIPGHAGEVKRVRLVLNGTGVVEMTVDPEPLPPTPADLIYEQTQQTIDGLQQAERQVQLEVARERLNDLLRTHTPSSPQVIAAQEQVRKAELALARDFVGRKVSGIKLNPLAPDVQLSVKPGDALTLHSISAMMSVNPAVRITLTDDGSGGVVVHVAPRVQ